MGGFALGLFVGEPMLLLDFRSVVRAISFEVAYYAPTGARNPLDLAPVWKYFSVLIPYATYPVLWLVIYLSTIYVISRRSLWQRASETPRWGTTGHAETAIACAQTRPAHGGRARV